jgi:hypothetical protein
VTLAVVPWIAFASLRRARRLDDPANQTWLDFRDRYGLIWAQRMREHFNRSATNFHLPVELRWQGFKWRRPDPIPGERDDAARLLQAVLQRFGIELHR